jgi:hypothetical protein
VIQPLSTDDRAHRGVAREPLSIVHILVSGEPAEYRLPKQPAQGVARVLAAAAIEELGDRDIGEPKGIVELTVRKQARRPM